LRVLIKNSASAPQINNFFLLQNEKTSPGSLACTYLHTTYMFLLNRIGSLILVLGLLKSGVSFCRIGRNNVDILKIWRKQHVFEEGGRFLEDVKGRWTGPDFFQRKA